MGVTTAYSDWLIIEKWKHTGVHLRFTFVYVISFKSLFGLYAYDYPLLYIYQFMNQSE